MKSHVLIMGGGIAGCSAALKLADEDFQVTLLESKETLLAGSSDDTPARLGLGFHYVSGDPTYLRASIDFKRRNAGLSDLCVAEDKEFSHPLRRGRYFIVVDSIFEAQKILEAYNRLKEEYARLVKEDQRNCVFGDPEEFFKILSVHKYEDHVNKSRVAIGIETAEHILNWPRFKAHMIKSIYSHKNITVHVNTKAVPDGPRQDNGLFHIKGVNIKDAKEMKFSSALVVNSTWYNIEDINHQAGFIPSTPEQIERDKHTHRVKALIHINLPEKLKNVNSMFFCFGPHCSLTNIGDGTGWLTYEPVSNVVINKGNLSKKSKRMVEKGLRRREANEISQGIIQGASAYIPSLVDAKLAEEPLKAVKVGVVRTEGIEDNKGKANDSKSLADPKSSIHKRDKLCVRAKAFGWIVSPAMKLLYGQQNGDIVFQLIQNHSAVLSLSQKVAEEARKNSNDVMLGKIIARQVQENLAADVDPDHDSKLSLPKDGGKKDEAIVRGAILAKCHSLKALSFFKPADKKEGKDGIDRDHNLLPSLVAKNGFFQGDRRRREGSTSPPSSPYPHKKTRRLDKKYQQRGGKVSREDKNDRDRMEWRPKVHSKA